MDADIDEYREGRCGRASLRRESAKSQLLIKAIDSACQIQSLDPALSALSNADRRPVLHS
ncbi:MAG: hypothetical protein QOE41_3340 [Mycobacterium sp.]|jgi:hypothetical protein|nr:hypothetical protein [Mycobacterium sp.]